MQDGDEARSSAHRDGIRECLARAASELTLLACEERPADVGSATASDADGAEGEAGTEPATTRTLMHVHAFAPKVQG